jgi:hypothetical protein
MGSVVPLALIAFVVLAAVVTGWIGGGLPRTLTEAQLRWYGLLSVALIVQVGAALGYRAGVERPICAAATALSYVFAVAWLTLNLIGLWRDTKLLILCMGLALALAGSVANGAVIAANGGMPVARAMRQPTESGGAGLELGPKHVVVTDATRFAFLGDRIELPQLNASVSPGDLLLWTGIVVGFGGTAARGHGRRLRRLADTSPSAESDGRNRT